MVNQLFALLVFTLLVKNAAAQQPLPDSLSVQDIAIAEAVAVFHQAAGLQSQLYKGKLHISYSPAMQGSAYYLSNDVQAGTIEYDHIVFKNVPMWYDEVSDKVVVQHFNKISAFELTSERVDNFSIGDHQFIRIVRENDNAMNTPPTGFYEVLSSGNLTVLARRKKLVAEFIENMEVKKRIDNKESFYAKKSGLYYAVNNERSLYNVIKDKKTEVQQYLRKNKLKLRKTPDLALTRAAVLYNQLTQ